MINEYVLIMADPFNNFCKLSIRFHCIGIIQPYLLNGDIEDPLKHDAWNLHEFAYHTASKSV